MEKALKSRKKFFIGLAISLGLMMTSGSSIVSLPAWAMQADWNINGHGWKGTMHINPNSGDLLVAGRFSGTVDFHDGKGKTIAGDLEPNSLTFQRYLNSGARQDYVGYFFTHPNSPDVTTMAGYF